jgi:hypothetical protein
LLLGVSLNIALLGTTIEAVNRLPLVMRRR